MRRPQQNIICSKLLSKFGVDVTLKEPRIAYREAIKKKVKVEGKSITISFQDTKDLNRILELIGCIEEE